jgi:hypothetical protein
LFSIVERMGADRPIPPPARPAYGWRGARRRPTHWRRRGLADPKGQPPERPRPACKGSTNSSGSMGAYAGELEPRNGDRPHTRIEHRVERCAGEHEQCCRAGRADAVVIGARSVIWTTRRSAAGAQRIRTRAARSSTDDGRFAAVERDGDHLADELSIG